MARTSAEKRRVTAISRPQFRISTRSITLQSFDARQTYFFRKSVPANCVFPHPNAEKPLEIT